MKQTFYSNGKLLIAGEYTVLDGASAFALPTKWGQYLRVEEGSGNTIKWISKDADGSVWLDLELPFYAIIEKKQDGDIQELKTLIAILHEAHKANPNVLDASQGFEITTELTFPRHWGLGSSSTLINNIAQWFAIDAFQLLWKSFGGSGYDIACAQNDTPIIYHLENNYPVIKAIEFSPAFIHNLYFIYLNRKQNSRQAIAAYKDKRNNLTGTLTAINNIICKVINAKDLTAFCSALEEQEQIMSKVLEAPTAKETLFPDFKGTIKSLGAWGGDFILAASEDDPAFYFTQKGYDTIIPFDEMILN